MFKKEIQKIKELTEKLELQGDITEDEADWIYVMNFFPWKQGTKTEYERTNFLAPYESLESLRSAFEKWYDAVERKVQEGKKGNFISSVPSYDIGSLDLFLTQPSSVRLIYHEYKNIALYGKIYTTNEFFLSRIGKTLTGDVLVMPGNRVKISRLGIIERMMEEAAVDFVPKLDAGKGRDEETRDAALTALGVPFLRNDSYAETKLIYPKEYSKIVDAVVSVFWKLKYDLSRDPYEEALKKASTVPKPAEDVQTKDIAFLSRITRLLRWGVDISEEDAYKVFLIFKYAQSLTYYSSKSKDETIKKLKQKQAEELFAHLNKWYETVHTAIKEGRSGNFTATIPLYYKCDMHGAGKAIRKCLRALPEECCFAVMLEKKDFDAYDSIGFHSDVEENRTYVRTFTYGLAKKAIDAQEYTTVEEGDEGREAFLQWSSGNRKDSILHAELEAMKQAGAAPVLAGFPDGSFRIMIPKKDIEKVGKILEIKKENLIGSEDFERSLAQKYEESMESDDSWIDITR